MEFFLAAFVNHISLHFVEKLVELGSRQRFVQVVCQSVWDLNHGSSQTLFTHLSSFVFVRKYCFSLYTKPRMYLKSANFNLLSKPNADLIVSCKSHRNNSPFYSTYSVKSRHVSQALPCSYWWKDAMAASLFVMLSLTANHIAGLFSIPSRRNVNRVNNSGFMITYPLCYGSKSNIKLSV